MSSVSQDTSNFISHKFRYMSILVSICVESNHRKLKIKTQLCGEGTDIGYVNYVCIFFCFKFTLNFIYGGITMLHSCRRKNVALILTQIRY